MSKLLEDLRKWFDPNHPEGGWKRINSKGEAIGPCAREPGEAKPKCMSNAKRAALSKKERAAAVRSKRKHDPNPERKGSPINVSNFGKGKLSEQMEQLDEKNKPTNPKLWSRAVSLARSKFDVYPSAYANGWAAKWYKSKGGGWESVNESKEDEREYDYEGDMIKSALRSIIANANRLIDMLEDSDNLPEWCQSKITLAEDYVSTVANYMTAEMNEQSDVFKNIRFAKNTRVGKNRIDVRHTSPSTDDEEHYTVGTVEFEQQLKHVKKRAMQESEQIDEIAPLIAGLAARAVGGMAGRAAAGAVAKRGAAAATQQIAGKVGNIGGRYATYRAMNTDKEDRDYEDDEDYVQQKSKTVKESRQAQIIKNVVKKKKTTNPNKFEPDPELSDRNSPEV